MKEFVSLTTVAMEIGKRHFFNDHALIGYLILGEIKLCKLKNFVITLNTVAIKIEIGVCCECWLPCVKLSLHYENINKVYIWRKMHKKMKEKKENTDII